MSMDFNTLGTAPSFQNVLGFDEAGTEDLRFRHENYKVQAYIGQDLREQRPVFAKIDTGCGRNLISLNALPLEWSKKVKPYKNPRLRASNGELLDFAGDVKLTLTIGDLQRQLWLGVIRRLPV